MSLFTLFPIHTRRFFHGLNERPFFISMPGNDLGDRSKTSSIKIAANADDIFSLKPWKSLFRIRYMIGATSYSCCPEVSWDLTSLNLTRAAVGGGRNTPPPLENFRYISQTSCFSATKLSVHLGASILHHVTENEGQGHHRSGVSDVTVTSPHPQNRRFHMTFL